MAISLELGLLGRLMSWVGIPGGRGIGQRWLQLCPAHGHHLLKPWSCDLEAQLLLFLHSKQTLRPGADLRCLSAVSGQQIDLQLPVPRVLWEGLSGLFPA